MQPKNTSTSISNITALLNAGIAAAKSNQRVKAGDLLKRAIQQDQNNVRAWLWLSSVVDDLAEQENCLKKILSIDPNHQAAQNGLKALKKKLALQELNPPNSTKDEQKDVKVSYPSTQSLEDILVALEEERFVTKNQSTDRTSEPKQSHPANKPLDQPLTEVGNEKPAGETSSNESQISTGVPFGSTRYLPDLADLPQPSPRDEDATLADESQPAEPDKSTGDLQPLEDILATLGTGTLTAEPQPTDSTPSGSTRYLPDLADLPQPPPRDEDATLANESQPAEPDKSTGDLQPLEDILATLGTGTLTAPLPSTEPQANDSTPSGPTKYQPDLADLPQPSPRDEGSTLADESQPVAPPKSTGDIEPLEDILAALDAHEETTADTPPQPNPFEGVRFGITKFFPELEEMGQEPVAEKPSDLIEQSQPAEPPKTSVNQEQSSSPKSTGDIEPLEDILAALDANEGGAADTPSQPNPFEGVRFGITKYLPELEEMEQEPVAEEPSDLEETETMPGWLNELGLKAPEPYPVSEEAEINQTPKWLEELELEIPQSDTSLTDDNRPKNHNRESSTPTEPAATIPSWLDEIEPHIPSPTVDTENKQSIDSNYQTLSSTATETNETSSTLNDNLGETEGGAVPKIEKERQPTSKYKKLSTLQSSETALDKANLTTMTGEEAVHATPPKKIKEPNRVTEPVLKPIAVSTKNQDIFKHEYTCPYCAAQTQPQDEKCSTCHNKLWSETLPHQKPSNLYQVLLVTHIVSNLLYLAFIILITRALIIQQLVSTLGAVGIVGLSLPFVIYFLVVLITLVRRQKVFFRIYLAQAVLLFGLSASATAGIIIYGLPLILTAIGVGLAILAVGQFFMALNLGKGFAFDTQRILLKVDPDLNTGTEFMTQGKLYAKQKMWALAVVHFRRASYQLPKSIEPLVSLAVAYINLNQFDYATEVLERAATLKPSDARISKLKAVMSEKRQPQPTPPSTTQAQT